MQTPASHNRPVAHFVSQSQTQGGSHFPRHFQLSEPQAPGVPGVSGLNGSVGAPSPSTTGSGAGSAKRASQKPPSRPSGSSGHAQATASPLKTMELTPAVAKRKRKLPEKEIPERVAAISPESALYAKLLEVESCIDATLARKKNDIVESLKNPLYVQKTLRIYVFNTFANQTGKIPDSKEDNPPSWSLKMIGKILEEGNDPVAAGVVQKSSHLSQKFSSFFKKITIYLDQNLYPDNHVILWDSSRSPVLHEGFEVKRKGNKEFTAIIRLEMNYVPEKFKLSPALQEVLGIGVETRQRILAALWHYVKIKKLQIPGDTSSFMCDVPLKKIFGEEKLKFATMAQKITQHLSLPQPIHLEHKIKLSGSSPAGNTCYDVLVDIPFLLEKEMSTFLADLKKNEEIDGFDGAISDAMKKIHEHCRRRAFFLGFSQSPGDFINALIASQARDLKIASGDANHNAEKERRSEFYNHSWIEDAVGRYLNRRPAGIDGPASK